MLSIQFIPPDLYQHMERARQYDIEQALKSAKPWTGKELVPTREYLPVVADSYMQFMRPYLLFPDMQPIRWGLHPGRDMLPAGTPHVTSPTGKWRYCHMPLPRGTPLNLYRQSRKCPGAVFDGAIDFPQLWDCGSMRGEPFMSLTPNEVVTLRPGTKKAKGHTVVAGLGLGYQLIDVCARPQVERVTLIEQSQDLIDWLWPLIQPKCGGKVTRIITGDVTKVLPTVTADAALVDVYPGYGHNDYERRELRTTCHSIGHIWCWGAFSTDD